MCLAADHKGAIHRKDIIRNGANDSRPFCHSYGHFFMKGGIYLPASPGGIPLPARFLHPSSYPYPPVHLFNLFSLLCHRTFLFFFSPVVIKFFVERLFLIFLLFFCSRSSIICNEITIKMIEKCRNVRFIMVDRESFRKYAMVVKGRRKPHTFHIYGQRGSACRETKGGLCHSLNGA